MGSSGGNKVVYTPTEQQQDESFQEMIAMMGHMMSQQNNIFAQQMSDSQFQMPKVPEVQKTDSIDWKKENDRLKNMMSAEYNLDRARRKGRMDTIHTSPLLDEDEAETTRSLLKG